jgi:hypothetical protein
LANPNITRFRSVAIDYQCSYPSLASTNRFACSTIPAQSGNTALFISSSEDGSTNIIDFQSDLLGGTTFAYTFYGFYGDAFWYTIGDEPYSVRAFSLGTNSIQYMSLPGSYFPYSEWRKAIITNGAMFLTALCNGDMESAIVRVRHLGGSSYANDTAICHPFVIDMKVPVFLADGTSQGILILSNNGTETQLLHYIPPIGSPVLVAEFPASPSSAYGIHAANGQYTVLYDTYLITGSLTNAFQPIRRNLPCTPMIMFPDGSHVSFFVF